MGAWSGATDDWDSNFDYPLGGSGSGFAGVWHVYDPPNWNGLSDYYFTDYRAPLVPDESKTWSPLALWATPDYTDPSIILSMQGDAYALPPPNRQYLLTLIQVPDGVVGAPDVGTVWTLPREALFTLELPTYTTNWGLEGYLFSFTVTATPEPASLVGLAVMLLLNCRARR